MGADKINMTWKDKQLAVFKSQNKRLSPVRNKQTVRQTTEPNWNLQMAQEIESPFQTEKLGFLCVWTWLES